jgi:copper oxidase (laccase) domain-containing protein
MNIAVEVKGAFERQVPTHARLNVFTSSINVSCFGKGFPWQSSHYNDFSAGACELMPYLETYEIGNAVIPDFRGMNAFVSGNSGPDLVALCHPPVRLWKTTRIVDGIEARRGLSVFSITADCPTVLLLDLGKKRALVLHCGRDALQPCRKDGSVRKGPSSVIHTAMASLMPTNLRNIRALILCGIGPASFDNRTTHPVDGDFYRVVVKHFRKTCGYGSVRGEPGEERIDLPTIIRAQLGEWGVGEVDQPVITWDNVDTYADGSFHSRRRDPKEPGCNCVLIDMERAFT